MNRLPGAEEKKDYYFGITPPPTLLARTSNTKWVKQKKATDDAPPDSRFLIATHNPQVIAELRKALEVAKPYSMTPVRIWPTESNNQAKTAPQDCPVIFWVCVKTESKVTPENALEAADRCKKYIKDKMGYDIDVEICQTDTGFPLSCLVPAAKK